MPIKLKLSNKNLLIFASVAIVISIIAFIVYISINNRDNKSLPIEIPLSFTTEHDVDISEDIIKSFNKVDKMSIYNISNSSNDSLVDNFLSKIGKKDLNKTNIQQKLYVWENTKDYIEYNKFDQTLYIDLEDGVSGKEITTDGEYGKGYIEYFMKENFGITAKYTNEKIERTGSMYRVVANRVIDDYPIYSNTYEGYTDTVLIDKNGNLYEGKFTVVSLTDADRETKIMDLKYISNAISSTVYPKNVFHGYYVSSWVVSDSGLPDNFNTSTDTEVLSTKSTANKVEIGYIFSNTSYISLTPVYRIQAEGQISSKDEKQKVPVVLYVNAMTPSDVYLPKN